MITHTNLRLPQSCAATPIGEESPRLASPTLPASHTPTNSAAADDEHIAQTSDQTICAQEAAPGMADVFRARRHRSLETTLSNVTHLFQNLLPFVQQRLDARLQKDLESCWTEMDRCAKGRMKLGQYNMIDLYRRYEAKTLARQAQYRHDQKAIESLFSNSSQWQCFNVYERLEYSTRNCLLALDQINNGARIDGGCL